MSSRSPRFPLQITIALMLALPKLATAADITWTNTAGGNWSTAANWNSGAGPVPGPGDVAHITTDGTYTVTLDADASVGGLDLGAASGTQTLRSSNRTLTLGGPSSIGAQGVLSMGASTVAGVGPLTNQGYMSLEDVTIHPALANNGRMTSSALVTLHGAFTMSVGSTYAVYGNGFCCAGHLVVDNGFTNNGTITLSSFNGSVKSRLLVNNGVLVNAAGAQIVLDPGSGGERELETSLENHGTIRADQPVRIHGVNSTLVNASDGTFLVNADVTINSTSFANSGAMPVAAGRTLTIFGPVLTLDGTGLAGPGSVVLRTVTASFNAPQNTATTRFTEISSTTINGPGSLTHDAAYSLFMKDATLRAAFSNQGSVSGEGVVYFNGPLTTAVGSTISISGNGSCCQGHLVAENGFTNNGTIILSSFGGSIKSRMLVNNGVLVNAPGARIILDAGSGGERTLELSLDNYGTVSVNMGPAQFNNPNQVNRAGGTIAVNGGDVYVTNGGTFTNCGLITVASSRTFNYSGGTLINGSTGVLAGAGAFNVSSIVQNGGTIDPDGLLTFFASTMFAPQSACSGGPGPAVNVSVCGPGAGTGYERLNITGTSWLSGPLNVTVPAGCCLVPGDEFRVFTTGARNGTFSSINVSGHGNAVFDAQYDATGLTLVVLSNQFALNATAGAHGTITPSGAAPVSCGGSETFTITPDACYHVVDVLVDGSSVGAMTTYAFADVQANHTISASFAPDTYTITASAGSGGSVAPGGSVAVSCGSSQAFTITAAAGFAIADVLVDGTSVGPVGTYEFTGLAANHTIEASFRSSGGSNGAPVVSITGPPSGTVFAVGTPVTFTGSFVDDAGDTHTAAWTFDGASQAGSVNESAHSVNAVRTFTTPGVYFVTLTVTDDKGASGSASTVDGIDATVVIYDPSGGFVTGGGWFNSPAGAYAANPSLTGKANFGFESKYKKGANTPSGETEFQFKVASLNFHSTAYEWLVVSGARAQYKGSGTINGAGDYAFMLTASDGDLLGGNQPDRFRIRIWNKGSGASIYDNNLGVADSTAPSTALGGGSIVIHKGSGTGPASALSMPTEPAEAVTEFALSLSSPNPTPRGAMITFDLPVEGHVRLAVYDAAGRVVATLADGLVASGRHSVAWDGRDRSGARPASGLYLVRIEGRPAAGGDRWVATRKLVRVN